MATLVAALMAALTVHAQGVADASKHPVQAERIRLWSELRSELGRAEVPDVIRDELRVHARRVAKLTRIRALAATAADAPNEARAVQLLTLENERHTHRLDELIRELGGTPLPPKESTPNASATDGAR